jgi:DivIVA domain-containing protein
MLTPDEIELKIFPVTLRGFDQTEVTKFLQAAADELQRALERAVALEGGAVLEAANRAAAAIMAAAEAEAEELTRRAADLRDEASRIRADAVALSERELKQAVHEGDEFKLKTIEQIEAIVRRTDAEVSALLQAIRENREDVLGASQHLVVRNHRKGSQRQLGQ